MLKAEGKINDMVIENMLNGFNVYCGNAIWPHNQDSYYSNRSRGDRKKQGKDDQVPALTQSAVSPKEFRKNWARLIQKIYNVNPLLCPKCLGSMKIISFIDQDELIERILRHLSLWETRNHDPPAESATHILELTYDDSYSQLPPTDYWLQ